MTRQSTSDARERIVADLEHVEKTGEPVAFERNGSPVAVLVSAADFALLERLRREDAEDDPLDLAAADEALAESDERIPYEQVRRELGLTD